MRDADLPSQKITAIFEGIDLTDFLMHDPAWFMDFSPNGALVGLRDTMARKRYANLLENIAEEGPDVFYTGKAAEDMIAAVQGANGTIT